ncbi:MAG TPA: CBS domain-containing protein, partial [Thermoproteales archaeon]|nr:CBS domain-containing protein [Thermoproteales archaeon]
MAEKNVNRLIVLSPSETVEGIISSMDIINYLGGGDKFNIILTRHKGNFYRSLEEPIETIMNITVIKAYLDEKLSDLLEKMVKYNVGAIPVVTREDRLYGIISEWDIVSYMSELITGKKVEDYMTREVVYIKSSATLKETMEVMVKSGFRRLPVVEDSIVKGIVVAKDIVHFFGSGEAY